jgi:hypothetical protein
MERKTPPTRKATRQPPHSAQAGRQEDHRRDDPITRDGAASLKKTGIDDPPEHFKGKKIRATGTVKEVDKIPRIEINNDTSSPATWSLGGGPGEPW